MILGDLGDLGGSGRRQPFRFATTVQRVAYTGSKGERIYDTDLDSVWLMDGSTAGGIEQAPGADTETDIADMGPTGFKATFAAGLGTVATLAVPVVNVAVTTAVGDNAGWTVGSDNTFTATFTRTRLVRFRAIFDLDVAAGADALALHLFKNGASAAQSGDQTVTAATPKLFELDVALNIANGDIVRVALENVDTTANVTTAAFADRADTLTPSGFLIAEA